MTNHVRLLVGTVAGVVLGLISMKLFPVGIQPGDTLSVGLGGGQETPLTVAAESRPEVIGDVMTEDGKRGRALISPAQTAGFVHIADGREVYVAGKSTQQAAELLAKESGEKVVSVRVAERRDVRVLPPLANLFYIIGRLFTNLLTMLALPLVVCSIVIAISKWNDVRRLGAMSWQTALFFAGTMLSGGLIGLTVVNVMKPGEGMNLSGGTVDAALAQAPSAQDWLLRALPANPIEAVMRFDIIGMTLFAIVIGAAIMKSVESKPSTVLALISSLNDALHAFLKWLMVLAPIGVCALIAYFCAIQSPDVMSSTMASLGKYFWCALIAIALMFALLTIIVRWLAKANPGQLLRASSPALMAGFGAGHTTAAMPLALASSDDAEIPPSVYGFVIPAGTALQMCGTVAFQTVATLFLAQALGIIMSPMQQLIVVLLCIFASVASVGMPGGALATLALPLTAAGVPLTQTAMLYAIDRPLEMLRTVVNTFGTMSACKAVQHWNREMVGEEGLEPPTSSL